MSRAGRAGAGILGAASLALLAACGGPTRVATLNQTTHIAGPVAATALRQALAKQGHPAVKVTCAKSIIVYVGPAVSCTLTGAGANHTVHFTFKTLDGVISLSSVKTS